MTAFGFTNNRAAVPLVDVLALLRQVEIPETVSKAASRSRGRGRGISKSGASSSRNVRGEVEAVVEERIAVKVNLSQRMLENSFID